MVGDNNILLDQNRWIDQAQCYKEPFPHFVIDDFLSEDIVQPLADHASSAMKASTNVFHGNRRYMTNTSLEFASLLESSASWQKFHAQLQSQEFFSLLFETIKRIDPNFVKTNVKQSTITIDNLIKAPDHPLQKKLCNLGSRKLADCNLARVVAYKCYQYWRKLSLIIRVFFSEFLTRNKKCQLLFDISEAGNGYGREIHRDSDHRLLVFLFYLNALDSEGRGGNLGIYRADHTKVRDSPQPPDHCCELVHSVEPKRNRFVAFLNSSTSYHGVECMRDHSTARLFCYGAFTLLGQPAIRVKERFGTEFHLYNR